MPTLSSRKKTQLPREIRDLLIQQILQCFQSGDLVQFLAEKTPFAEGIANGLYTEQDLTTMRESLLNTGHLVAIGRTRGRKLKTTSRGLALVQRLQNEGH